MSEAVLLVGTRKGLWIGRSDGDRAGWEWDEPQFLMDAVYSVCVDDRGDSPRLFAGATSEHWGPQVFRSDDLGRSWTETPNGAIRFPEGTDTSLERVWQIQPAGAHDPEVVYAGSEPSALFRSTDRGESFELVRAAVGPPAPQGVGRGVRRPGHPHHRSAPDRLPAVDRRHVDRRCLPDRGRAGVVGTGERRHQGLLPARPVARVRAARAQGRGPPRQSRTGCSRRTTTASTAATTAAAAGRRSPTGCRADFGFSIVVHPARPDTVYVFPLVADSERVPPGAKARVWRSDDAGGSWRELGTGLPDEVLGRR